jgi:3-hydroxybutyryl-CoA dehydrogenase
MNPLSASSAVVGIVGAGTMGTGIAEVAARAGHPVRLFDAAPGAADAAREHIVRSFAGRAAKGQMAAAEAEAAARRVTVAGALGDLAPATLVVEAVAEDMAAKRRSPPTHRRFRFPRWRATSSGRHGSRACISSIRRR